MKRVAKIKPELESELANLHGRLTASERPGLKRQQAEEKLRESESRYRHLFENNPQPMLVYDLDTLAILQVNEAAVHHYGYSREEFQSMTIKDIRPPEDIPALLENVSKTVAPFDESGKGRHRKKNGTTIDVEITSHSFSFAKRNARLVLVNDVTERKRAEEAQQRYAQRLKTLHAIDQDILAAQSPEAIAQAAVRHIRQLIPCPRASVTLFDMEAHQVTVLAVSDSRETRIGVETHFPLKDFPQKLKRGQVHLEHDFLTRRPQSPLVQALITDGVRSCANVPLIVKDELIGSLNVASDNPATFTPESLDIALELADSLAIAIQNARLFQSVSEQHAQLRALTARLAEVEEAERRRLAQELHDRIGQNLSALSINLNIMQSQLPAESVARMNARLEDSQRLVAETAVRIRDVMTELRPPVLDDYGFLAALHWYGQQFSERTGVLVMIEGEELTPRLPLSIELALFRVAQEALTNVVKHSRANQVTMTLRTFSGIARFTISDDGTGFDPATLRHREQPGWGLVTMRERVEAIGGHLRVESAPGKGTRVIAEVTR